MSAGGALACGAGALAGAPPLGALAAGGAAAGLAGAGVLEPPPHATAHSPIARVAATSRVERPRCLLMLLSLPQTSRYAGSPGARGLDTISVHPPVPGCLGAPAAER